MNKHDKPNYHHGDLRKALLAAAERELEEKGVEGFTLRSCAKRAGVSHAAPKHHFGDANGLLTALAAVGFERFVTNQTARRDAAGGGARDRQIAAGLGYIDFALANPALFRLMFSSQRIDFSDPDLAAAGGAGFETLLAGIAEVHGRDPRIDDAAMLDATASWAIVHGLANLLMSGRLKALQAMTPDARARALTDIVGRGLTALPPKAG